MNQTLRKNLEREWPQLKQKIKKAGFFSLFDLFPQGEFYLVGGVVRDLMLGRKTKDLDFVIRGVPFHALEKGLRRLGKVQFVGKNFGVFKLLPNADRGAVFDVALPRMERSMGLRGAYREFEVESDSDLPIEEDLKRRDFTVNAMAFELRREKVIDPYGGKADLLSKKLRAVGDPHLRFQEDYSRMLRGIRFACQGGFQLEEETWRCLKMHVSGLSAQREDGSFIVPREVLGKELVQAFTYDPVKAFDLLEESGAMEMLLPEFLPMKGCPQPKNFHSEGDVWTHTRLALEQLTSATFQREFPGEALDAETVFGVLFHDLGKPGTLRTPERDGTDRIRFDGHDRVGGQITHQICERLRLSQYPREHPLHLDGERLVWLVGKHLLLVQGQVQEMKATTIERYFINPSVPGHSLLKLILADSLATIHENGSADLTSYYQVKVRILEIQEKGDRDQKIPPPLLSGKDVMNLYGIGPGPEVGQMLTLLREEQLTGRIKNRIEAISFLSRSKDEREKKN